MVQVKARYIVPLVLVATAPRLSSCSPLSGSVPSLQHRLSISASSVLARFRSCFRFLLACRHASSTLLLFVHPSAWTDRKLDADIYSSFRA